jgi:N12 class adenine-specific DNA methylase
MDFDPSTAVPVPGGGPSAAPARPAFAFDPSTARPESATARPAFSFDPSTAQPAADASGASEPPDTGWLSAAYEGGNTAFRGGLQTAQAIGGGRPVPSEPTILAAQPIEWRDVMRPGVLGRKFVYGMASTAPEIVGFGVGAAMAGGPETPVGMLAGAAGAMLANAAKSFGPSFGAELQRTPEDPDAAFNRALTTTGISAAFTGGGFAAFGVAPFQSTLKNIMFQAFGVQPALSAAETATTNVAEGRPAGEGVAQGMPGAVLMTAAPMLAHAGAARLMGSAGETPPDPVAARGAAAQGRAGQVDATVNGTPRTPEQAALDEEAQAQAPPAAVTPPAASAAPPAAATPAPVSPQQAALEAALARTSGRTPLPETPVTPDAPAPMAAAPFEATRRTPEELAEARRQWEASQDARGTLAQIARDEGVEVPEPVPAAPAATPAPRSEPPPVPPPVPAAESTARKALEEIAKSEGVDVPPAPKPVAPTPTPALSRPEQILAELDARGAPDADYRAAFSTGTKNALRAGETWRGRLVDWIASEKAPADAPAHDKLGTTPAHTEAQKALNDIAADEGVKPPPRPRAPRQPKPPAAPAIDWKPIGENFYGHQLFQDDRGVRSYIEEGVRHTENVGVRPDGSISVRPPHAKDEMFRLPSEARPREPAPAKPAEAAVPPRPADYGAGNKIFTASLADKARERLRAKLTRLSSGFDPEFMLDGLTLAGYHVEAGARSFLAYSRAMVGDLGDAIRPYLAQFYTAVRMHPGMDTAGMDDHAAVETELRRQAEAPTPDGPLEDDNDDAGRGHGTDLDQSPGGELQPPGPIPGQSPGDGNPGDVAPGLPGGVPPAGESGNAGKNGVRPDDENAGIAGGVHPGGAADTGREGGSGKGLAHADDERGGRKLDEPTPAPIRPNFHIDNPELLVGGTPKVRFARNRAALETYATIQDEQRAPTPAELETMAGFIGWGSFGQDLFLGTFENQPKRPGWDTEAAWLREHLGKEAWDSANASIVNAHYTDPPTVKAMWDVARAMGFTGGRILEPSMGIGNFFGLMPREIMANSTLTGIELEETTAGMAKLLYPDAGIHNMGYERSATPDDFYDLVIGNWPFSAVGPADRRYDRMSPSLHNYFFLKAMDQTRPGGLVMGITSAYTMDSADRAVRMELAKKGDLVAAFRLPSGAFDKYAGTKVVTDLLVFRKRATENERVLDEPWINSSDHNVRGTPATKIHINNLFLDHPEQILGTLDFGSGTTSYRPGMLVNRPENYAQLLEGLAQRVPADAYQPIVRGNEPRFETSNAGDHQRSVVIGQDGKLYQVQGERRLLLEDIHKPLTGGTAKQSRDRIDQVKRLVAIRQLYGALIDADRDGRSDANALRAALADQFNDFRAQHGAIAKSDGLKVLNRVKDPAYAMVRALERPDGSPAAILSEATVRSRRSLDNPTIADAYVLARNEQAHFDMDRVAQLAGVTREQAEQHLLATNGVLRTPGGGFEPADTYLSGNVRKKLAEAKQALALGEPMQPSVDALAGVIPKDVPYFEIQARIGAPWVGDDAYKAFIGDLLGLAPGQRDGIEVRFAGSRWRVKLTPQLEHTEEASTIWGHPRALFAKIIEAAMGNTPMLIRDPADKDGGPYLNEAATEEVNAKIAALKEKFTDWAWADPERKILFEKAYNETMNAVAKGHFDGSFLDLAGMALKRGNDPFSLRRHQINGIWRGVILGRGLFAHEVGTGKTYTMGGIAVEGRRYGVFRKPVVFAHNANSGSVAGDFQQMYPGGKFLYVDNLSPKEIATTLHRIATEDWDAVIMPHSLIDRMALKRETLMELAKEQIADLESEAIGAAQDNGEALTVAMMDDPDPKAMGEVRSPTAKALVTARKRVLANIEKQAHKASREGAIAFEDLGIDAILVDEAHEFKKPPLATRMNLKGLNTETSDRSIALSLLTGYVKRQNNGRGVFLFTGTPITNALNEIFNLSRYFMDDKLEQAGIKAWDTWFSTFAEAETNPELTAGGTVEPVQRLSAFHNTDELVRVMSEFTDVVQAKDMPEFTPRATPSGKTLKSPDLTPEERDFLENGRTPNGEGRPYKKTITDVAQMSPAQRDIQQDIQDRIASYKALSKRDRYNLRFAKPADRRMPLITDAEGPKASLDARMYDPSAPDVADSKVNRTVRNVLKHYQEPGAAQAIFVDSGYKPGTGGGGVANPFVLVHDLIAKLVRGGIPRDEIAVVNGELSPEQKKAVADAMNAGTKRVVIGLSSTLGVGVNMQNNLRAMHHMDAPWRPGDLEQRNGRGERQGNDWNTVLEYRYLTEGIDGRRWNVLSAKDAFIKQFINAFNDTSGKRLGSLEGDAADIGSVSDIMESLSAAAGDPRYMLRAKYKMDVDRLNRRERMHTQGVVDARNRAQWVRRGIASLQDAVRHNTGILAEWDGAAARAEAVGKERGETRRLYEVTAEDDQPPAYLTGGQIQDRLDEQIKRLEPNTQPALITINGAVISAVMPDLDSGGQYLTTPYFTVLLAGDIKASNIGPHVNMPRILGQITPRRQAIERWPREIETDQESAERLDAAGRAEFPQADRLLKKRQQLADLETDLQVNPSPPPAWLRFGAPIDTPIYVNGQERIVRGHRVDADYLLMTDDGDVSYLDAKDASGQRVFDAHPPPVQRPAPVAPEWLQAEAKKRGESAQVLWHDGDFGVIRSGPPDEPAYQVFKRITERNGQTSIRDTGMYWGRPTWATISEWKAVETGVNDAESREANQRALEKAKAPPRLPTTAYDQPQTGRVDLGDTSGRGQGRADFLGTTDSGAFARREDAGAQTPLDDDTRAAVLAHGQRMMRTVGLPGDVGLRLVDRLTDSAGNPVDAHYTRGLITLALDTDPARIPGRLFHETIHAAMDPAIGLLTNADRRTLGLAADRWLAQGDNRVRLERQGYGEAELRDEAIARMGEDALMRGVAAPGPYQKVVRFVRALGRWLRGEGFRTADDVYAAMLRGERSRGAAAATAQQTRGSDAYARRPATPSPATPAYEVLADKRGLSRVLAEIKASLSPTALRGAKPMEAMARRHAAEQAQSYAQAAHALERVRAVVDQMPRAAQADFTHRMETGQRQATPQAQAVADMLRQIIDAWTARVQSLGRGYLANAVHDYMGHIWGNYPEWSAGLPTTLTQAEMEARARAGGKAPLLGRKAFLKQRTFPTQMDGINAGLIPVTWNPVDLQLLKLRELQKFYHGTTLADKMKVSGFVHWVPAGDERAALASGQVKLDDRVFQPRPAGAGNPAGFGRLEPGNWYAPEPVARIFNNYMSRGLAGQSVIYDVTSGANNALNSLQLGLSGFHATFIALDTMISRTALGLQQLREGQIGKGATSLLLGATPASVAKAVRDGSKLRSAWLDPAGAAPEWRRLAEDLNAGGGRINMDQFYKTSASGAFFRSWSDVKNPASVIHQAAQMFRDEPAALKKAVLVPLRIAGRIIDTINEPLMGQLVPRAKLGVFADLARNWHDSHPGASDAEHSAAMIKFWDSIDNRMGEMVYDNVFWNKTLKDIAFITTRSVGWNLGTVREIGGSVVDAGRAVADIAGGRAPQFTTRMAYTVALPMVTALYGAILTYLATGQSPQQMMDYFFPPTGNQDPNSGEAERRSIPGYIKDVIEYTKAPVQTVLQKASPLMQTLQELYHNRDFYGGIIHDPDRDSGAVPAYADYLLNQAIPFSWRSWEKLHEKPAPMLDQALSFWGIQPAPKSVTEPERGEAYERRQNATAYKRRAAEHGHISVFNGSWPAGQPGPPSP